MEAVHETYRTPWISDLVSVKAFLNAAYRTYGLRFNITEELCFAVDERMMRYFGDKDMLEKQEESCSAKLLDSDGDSDLDIDFCVKFTPPKGNKLLTLKLQAAEMILRKKEDIKNLYKDRVLKSSRYRHCRDTLEIFPKKQDPNLTEPEDVPVKHPEVVLTVQIFRPREELTTDMHEGYNTEYSVLHVDQQFLVLGSQYLTELRDAICCSSDEAVVGEFSEDPRSKANKACKEIYKSGFFYINGVLYNDMREPQNKDYSRPVIEWSKMACGVGPFSVAKMEGTKFIDLEIQLGLPYVYQHQGHCEHMLVFSDLRLMSSRDRQNMMDYPLTQLLHLQKKVNCMVCMLFTAKWVTTEDARLCELPFFFCDKCFTAFNYDVKGNKIADFKAHQYVDRSVIF